MKDSNSHQTPQLAASAAEGDHSSPDSDDGWLKLVVEKVKSLQYGVVQIVVHDSRIVQVESTERFRFTPAQKRQGAS